MWQAVGKVAVAVVITRLLWSLIKGIYGSFLAAFLGLNVNLKKTGEWAGKCNLFCLLFYNCFMCFRPILCVFVECLVQ